MVRNALVLIMQEALNVCLGVKTHIQSLVLKIPQVRRHQREI